MAPMRWDKRFLASTRGRVVALLRRGERTVTELAEVLELTDNAVRAHLAALERDGLVEQRGVRRGVGKPAQVYGLAAEAERLFPKAYGLVLGQLLGVLSERMGPEAIEELLIEVGRRAAGGRVWSEGGPRARLEAAVAVIEELGGLAELEEREGGAMIRGYSCPFAAVAAGHPQLCRLAEALLAEVIGAPVRERCTRGERPRCSFDVALAGEA